MKYIISLIIISTSVFLDQLTKIKVVDHFNDVVSRTFPVIENFFNITYVRNYGVTFGMLRSMPDMYRRPLLIILPITIMFILFYMLYKTDKKEYINYSAFSLIISGAIGNIIDRIRLNFVIDFLDFQLMGYHWPSFNIADTVIVMGMGLLFILVLQGKDVFFTRPESSKLQNEN